MTTTLKKLITLLRDGEFHSGEQLGKSLGLTRSGIWKLIQQFPAWDIFVESITNKGYRIPQGLTLLEKEKILPFLTHHPLPQKIDIQIFDTLPSTNDYLLNIAKEKTDKCVICLAEKQTSGKGRRGRTWTSPFAKNIYLSILWHFPKDACELSGLSLAISLAVVETLKIYGIKHPVGLKWPNDVLWNNQKLAGILVELSGETHSICSSVIGVGLNVNMSNTKGEPIPAEWADVQMLSDNPVNRNELTGVLLNELIKTLTVFQNQGFSAFIEKWKSFDLVAGKQVSVLTPTAVFQGIGRGIDERGLFLLEDETGALKSFSSGEVSVRLHPNPLL